MSSPAGTILTLSTTGIARRIQDLPPFVRRIRYRRQSPSRPQAALHRRIGLQVLERLLVVLSNGLSGHPKQMTPTNHQF
jgi:hypothetical protein